MISIDTNMYLLCSLFNISFKKMTNEYSGLSVEEIMEAEAAQGNVAASHYSKEVLGNPVKLIELFQLFNPENKFAILSNMSEHDLEEMLPMLEQKDLIAGLNFFTKDKLLKMMEKVPIEQLVKLTFEMFSPEHLMMLMPEKEIDKVLTETQMDKGLQVKYLMAIEPQILLQMFESATGKPITELQGQTEAMSNNMTEDDRQKNAQITVGLDGQIKNLDPKSLIHQISNLPDQKFKEALLSMPPATKQDYILNISKDDPKIFEKFDPAAYTAIINQKKTKQEIIQCSNVIENEQLIKMIEQLPKDLTAVVLTQVDTKQFAEMLQANFKNILREIVAG